MVTHLQVDGDLHLQSINFLGGQLTPNQVCAAPPSVAPLPLNLSPLSFIPEPCSAPGRDVFEWSGPVGRRGPRTPRGRAGGEGRLSHRVTRSSFLEEEVWEPWA